MKNLIALVALASVAAAGPAAAQNLVITNARILDGTGKVIERGAVVVRDGKIASVATGNPTAVPGARVINARGMTVMPGFIDAHRHPIPGNTAEWLAKDAAAEMRGFLEAGFTTVVSAITPDEGLELRRRTESGAIKGPRIFAARLIPLARPAGGRGNASARGGAPAAAPAPEDRRRLHRQRVAAIRRASTTLDRRFGRPSRPARSRRRTPSKRSTQLRRPASTTSRP